MELLVERIQRIGRAKELFRNAIEHIHEELKRTSRDAEIAIRYENSSPNDDSCRLVFLASPCEFQSIDLKVGHIVAGLHSLFVKIMSEVLFLHCRDEMSGQWPRLLKEDEGELRAYLNSLDCPSEIVNRICEVLSPYTGGNTVLTNLATLADHSRSPGIKIVRKLVYIDRVRLKVVSNEIEKDGEFSFTPIDNAVCLPNSAIIDVLDIGGVGLFSYQIERVDVQDDTDLYPLLTDFLRYVSVAYDFLIDSIGFSDDYSVSVLRSLRVH